MDAAPVLALVAVVAGRGQVTVRVRVRVRVRVVLLAPVFGFFHRSRPVLDDTDYTNNHLPIKEDASFAIFAARMAFSNF